MPEEIYRKIFSKNLNRYMEINQKTQTDIVNDLGFNKSAVSTWCNGTRLPRMDKVNILAKYFGVERSDLTEDKTEKDIQRKGVVINVLGRVAAGIPIEAIEEIIDTEEITLELARTGKFFGLKIKGDSMSPNICDGDVVIVRQQEDAESGDIIIATVNGDEATCKRLRKYKDGIELISNNPSYAPFEFNNKEIAEKPVKIIGKVVELRRKF